MSRVSITTRITPENKKFLNAFAADMGFSRSRLIEYLIETLKAAIEQQQKPKEVN